MLVSGEVAKVFVWVGFVNAVALEEKGLVVVEPEKLARGGFKSE